MIERKNCSNDSNRCRARNRVSSIGRLHKVTGDNENVRVYKGKSIGALSRIRKVLFHRSKATESGQCVSLGRRRRQRRRGGVVVGPYRVQLRRLPRLFSFNSNG